MLFSNSHATNLSLWELQVAALEADFNVVRYDQRGHGLSPPCNGSLSFDGLAQDVIHILDAVAVERAALVGVSMGGVTVMRCAAAFPNRVARVLASDCQWSSPPAARQLWSERIVVASRDGMATVASQTVTRWFTEESVSGAEVCIAHARRMIESTSAEGYSACAAAMQMYDFSGDYPQLTVPVCYVAGERDGRLPDTLQAMCAATPGAQFVSIANAGHLPNLERPREFNAVLADWLRPELRS